MTHCSYHPCASLERIAQHFEVASTDGANVVSRTMLRCTAMLSEKLRCPFVAIEYDAKRREQRKCYSCGVSLKNSETDNTPLTATRCVKCKARDSANYRARQKIRKRAGRKQSAQKPTGWHRGLYV